MNTEVESPPPRVSRWRNGLAHWTSNSKVAGSSPARDVIIFFFSFPKPTVLHLEYISMWTRTFSRWRVLALFSSRSYTCKKTNNEVCSGLLSSESKLLKMNQIHQHSKSISGSLNCGLQLQDRTRDEAFTLPFHSSLQEHLSITRMLWFEQKCKPGYLRLPAHLEIISCLDPYAGFEVHKEAPTESMADKGDIWKGKLCSSILKKRRSKMNKHKYKKRRKKNKFLRRKLRR